MKNELTPLTINAKTTPKIINNFVRFTGGFVVFFGFSTTDFLSFFVVVYFFPGSLKELFKPTMRLKTGAPSLESL